MRFPLLLCGLLLFGACKNAPNKSAAQEVSLQRLYPSLRTGDIVLRNGKDELSRIFRNLNSYDRSFSHCGILLNTNKGPQVVHIIESGANKIPDLRLEDFSHFVSPAYNTSFRVIRYTVDSVQLRDLPLLLDSLRQVPVHFDLRFDWHTDTALYCTELVYKVFRRLRVPDSVFQISKSKNARLFMGTDGLYIKNQHKTICELSYK